MRITLLIGIVLAITYPAIYVAAANVNGAIFTGQDIPLLGLRSYTDILHNGILLTVLVAGLAAAGVAGETRWAETIGRQIARRNITILVLLVLNIGLNRGAYFKRDVQLDVKAEGITVTPRSVLVRASDQPEVPLQIAASREAALGEYRVTVTGTPSTGKPAATLFIVKVVAQ
jgi:hypothetical protein